MLRSRKNRYYDWITVGIYLSLLVIGWIAQYSVSASQATPVDFLNLDHPMTKQSLYLLMALLVFVAAQWVEEKFWHTFSYLIYSISLILLVLVLFVGTEINGAKAWFNLGGFSFQPAELAKFGTALALSSFMTFYKTNLKQGYFQLISFGIIAVPLLLVLLQPDAGSGLTFLSFFIMLFLEGLNPIYFIGIASLLIVFIVSFLYPLAWIQFALIFVGFIVAWVLSNSFRLKWWMLLALVFIYGVLIFYLRPDQLIYALIPPMAGMLVYLWKTKEEVLALVIPFSVLLLIGVAHFSVDFMKKLEPHQQERIKVWLKPEECDPRGSLYNVLQSKVAIGAGGFAGTGFMEGHMTKLKFVPEQSTDFIFSSIGEEHGFIGGLTLILLFAFLIFRIINMSQQADRKFFSTYAACVAGLLFIHVMINIGMTIGLFPIIGIPLPFISKGGSALIGFSLMLGVLFNMQSKS